ncbi:MAG: ATP-dependent DNA helicase RecG [Vampirovibrionales bacterium]
MQQDIYAQATLLHRACEAEVRHQYTDVRGKKQRFSSFSRDVLQALVAMGAWRDVDKPVQKQLQILLIQWPSYSLQDMGERRRLVHTLQQMLAPLLQEERVHTQWGEGSHSLLSEERLSPSVEVARQHSPEQGEGLEPSLEKPRLTHKPMKVIPALDEGFLQRPVMYLPKVGPVMAQKLQQLGVHTVLELLRHFPRSYLDYTQQKRIDELIEGEQVTLVVRVHQWQLVQPQGKKVGILKLLVKDTSGKALVTWFLPTHRLRAMEALYQKQFPVGAELMVSGLVKYDRFSGLASIDHPQLELLEHTPEPMDTTFTGLRVSSVQSQETPKRVGKVLPIYPLTQGLSLQYLRKLIQATLETAKPYLVDCIPEVLQSTDPLLTQWSLIRAYEHIHGPDTLADAEGARSRLAFDELFAFQCRLSWIKYQYQQGNKALCPVEATQTQGSTRGIAQSGGLVQQFLATLPFTLTGSQQRAYEDIARDMHSGLPMYRLVQGDVGSGKTVVAILALLLAIEQGEQGVLMAPTEILAEQHHLKLTEWLTPLGLKVGFLAGKLSAKQKREQKQCALTGQSHVVVGTHALIQDSVAFARLGLVVIDEQHRFGVKQRSQLLSKGSHADLLSMTATPIPRTLSMTLHGDLDISLMTDRPPGRKPIQTTMITGSDRALARAYQHMKEQLFLGRQAYIIYPLVDKTEEKKKSSKSSKDKAKPLEGLPQEMSLKDATTEAKKLQETVFNTYQVGLLHGQMSAEEKSSVMAQFKAGAFHVLVSTTVVEVGVDVPNATMMLIEHAERFGLAQLHQLRGRVGRGSHQSYCYLVNQGKSPKSTERLQVLVDSEDGFYIAEKDLELRGPGEMLGTLQSGDSLFALADLMTDRALVERSRHMVQTWLSATPSVWENQAFWKLIFAKTDHAFQVLSGG